MVMGTITDAARRLQLGLHLPSSSSAAADEFVPAQQLLPTTTKRAVGTRSSDGQGLATTAAGITLSLAS
jgi:hypothetical protein